MSGFPRVASYLAALPHGADSYPECKTKASAYREALAQRPLTSTGLPLPLAELVVSPVLMSAWIPEVHAMAMGLAIADQSGMTDAEFLGWIYQLNHELLGGPTYQFLMASRDVESMLKHAQVRWHAMHRGVELKGDEVGQRECGFQMTFPPRLFDELLLHAFARTFQAGLDLAGTTRSQVALTGFGETTARFRATWSEEVPNPPAPKQIR